MLILYKGKGNSLGFLDLLLGYREGLIIWLFVVCAKKCVDIVTMGLINKVLIYGTKFRLVFQQFLFSISFLSDTLQSI